MLNISPNSIHQRMEMQQFRSYKLTTLSKANSMFTRWLLLTLTCVVLLLFMPWTQNIQSKGKVTTLRPEQRPQTIHSIIAGRIERWYVQEGKSVAAGDTIVFLSEVKSDYFDPDLIDRTGRQVVAKEGAMQAYDNKAVALDAQVEALRSELDFKVRQLTNKIRQTELKVISDSIDLERARIDQTIAERQFNRTDTLYQEGLKSLTEVENKRLKMQETSAKRFSAENKLASSHNELDNARLELSSIRFSYQEKIAKADSEKFSTLSMRFDAEASANKLRIERSNYERRNDLYYITAPQDGIVSLALKRGIGETIKEGEPLASIVPMDYDLAVELFIKPMDFPLIRHGQEVRFIFDGWPAFIFSGWPGQSFGTYRGRIVAIDNVISPNGMYRTLVAPDDKFEPWPEALRPGSGANGIALLNNVPLWYEIWRRLNGFPPDYYQDNSEDRPKFKAPVRSLK